MTVDKRHTVRVLMYTVLRPFIACNKSEIRNCTLHLLPYRLLSHCELSLREPKLYYYVSYLYLIPTITKTH